MAHCRANGTLDGRIRRESPRRRSASVTYDRRPQQTRIIRRVMLVLCILTALILAAYKPGRGLDHRPAERVVAEAMAPYVQAGSVR